MKAIGNPVAQWVVHSQANQEVWSSNPNRCGFFPDLNRALESTQPQMGTRAIWEVNAARVHDANPITIDKSRWLMKKWSLNVILLYAPRAVTGILTFFYNWNGMLK
jgi:hypothetical protein